MRWLKEPLIHFLVLGGLIFAWYAHVTAGRPGAGEIRVTRGVQQHLLTAFSRTWQRAPSQKEFQGLISDWIRGEIATREAMKMGLDTDDVIVRRRLRQKLELLAEDISSAKQPDEAQLRQYLQEHQADYLEEPVYTLEQVYFSEDQRGTAAQRDAEQALVLLTTGGELVDPATVGDPLPLPHRFENARVGSLAAQFGARFVEELKGLEPGRWQGPIHSGFGLHLVRIEHYTPGRPMTLDEARDQVQRDWSDQRRREAIDSLYQRLGEKYKVTVEPLAAEQPAP